MNKLNIKGKIWFVAHPHRLRSMQGRRYCPWNRTTSHYRKFMQSDSADYLDAFGNLHKDETIYFLGEFECCSEVRKNPTTSRYKYIHKPFFTHLDYIPEVLNTDPFVFGDNFYYACCKLENGEKWGIQENDIIIFGSYLRNDNSKIVVDTVMVLGKKINRMSTPGVLLPSAYYDVTLSKIPVDKPIWIGKMITDYAECFSFVPCRTDENFAMPIISLQNFIGAQNVKPVEVENLNEVFNDIKRQLFDQGFLLGVRIDMPKYKIISMCEEATDAEAQERIAIRNEIGTEISDLENHDTRRGLGLRPFLMGKDLDNECEEII